MSYAAGAPGADRAAPGDRRVASRAVRAAVESVLHIGGRVRAGIGMARKVHRSTAAGKRAVRGSRRGPRTVVKGASVMVAHVGRMAIV
ncbi:hypothetical protein GCM10018785_22720 [Streptomyces longispororuber]|uniref:Uncharacterized protein n=1 Tax=Streptomyces longispororuber TaxID=68230 RepID=A0A919DK53_9ACTN|nr:hypothetical protein GCM10018785_22720 [Streptomyces longispororuber]